MVMRARGDPSWYLREVLRWDPWEKQIEIIEAIRDYRKVAVKSCHDSGKTAIAARIVPWFMCAFPPATVPTTAPGWRQVKELLWREIHRAYRESELGPLPLGGTLLDTKLEWTPNCFAIGLSTNDPLKFLGFHNINILFIADEAPGVEQDVFNAAGTILTSENARELLIGNPYEASGHFYDAFHGLRALYKTISISAFDTPNFTAFGITLDDIRNDTWERKITGPLPRPYLITPRWVRDKWLEWTSGGEAENQPLWMVQVLGEFPEVAADQLVPLSWVERAIVREIAVPAGTAEILGVDVARFGDDKTVICAREGSVAKSFESYWHQDTMVTAGRIIEALKARGAKGVNVDQDGLGAGVVDRLKELGYPVVGISAAGSAYDKARFKNRRSELWWGLRERFRLGDIQIPRDEQVIQQLVGMKYEITSAGQIEVETKEEMKKRGLKSPDQADALMLAFAGDITTSKAGDDWRRNIFRETFYGRPKRRKTWRM